MQNKFGVLLFRKLIVVLIALAGVLTTIKLAFIYYDSNFNPYALPSFCSVNQYIDCDGVAQTTHSQFMGIPLAYWGMFLYLFILLMTVVDYLKKIKFLKFLEVFKNPMVYVSALGFISFALSMVLAGVSIFEIKKVCILCLVTYFLNLLIALVAVDIKDGFLRLFKTSVDDFVSALKEKKYLVMFLILSTLAGCVLLYTTLSNCFTPQVKRYKEFKHYQKLRKDNPFVVTGNVMGDKNAKLKVYVYTDYECPVCQTYDVIISRAAQELSNVEFIHKNLPLDSKCNTNLPTSMHENACIMAKYAIAAEKQGRFWEFNAELFEKQPKNEKEIEKIAGQMGFNVPELKRDAYSDFTSTELRDDIESAMELRIDGTPAVVINGKVYMGIKPYYELKRILMEAGANERNEKQ